MVWSFSRPLAVNAPGSGRNVSRCEVRSSTGASFATSCLHSIVSIRPHADHEIESISKIGKDGTRTVREQVLRSTRGMRFAVDCGPQLLKAITNGIAPSTSERATEVIATMRQRLYELGLVIGGADG